MTHYRHASRMWKFEKLTLQAFPNRKGGGRRFGNQPGNGRVGGCLWMQGCGENNRGAIDGRVKVSRPSSASASNPCHAHYALKHLCHLLFLCELLAC